jgi:serine/threonine protein kinase
MQFLTIDSVAGFLIQQELISPDVIVQGKFYARQVSRRNSNFEVRIGDRDGYFIKQPAASLEADPATISREATFYAAASADIPSIQEFIPKFLDYFDSPPTLVIELVKEAEPLSVSLNRRGAGRSVAFIAAKLGRALALVHDIDPVRLRSQGLLVGNPSTPPWIFGARQPRPQMLRIISPGNLTLIATLQNTDSFALLDTLGAAYQYSCVIHGDIRSENLLIASFEQCDLRLAVIDWEHVQFGDPAWDIACTFQELALSLMRYQLDEPTKANARDPAGEQMLHSAVQALWHSYSSARGLTADAARALLRRVVLFSAAKMVLTAYEIAIDHVSLPPLSRALLTISAAIMTDPALEQVRFYGLYNVE